MSRVKVEIQGLDKLQRLLIRGGAEAAKATGRALYEEGQEAFAESQRIVPRDTGALAGSGHIYPPHLENGDIVVELGYGGPAAPYALYVHEDLQARHDPGKQAKYLETPVTQQVEGMGLRVARKVESAIERSS